jgi:hypothetical protein
VGGQMMTLAKTVLTLVLSLVLWYSGALCQDSTARIDAARELVEHIDLKAIVQSASDDAPAELMKSNPSWKPYEDLVRAYTRKYLDWDSIGPQLVTIYANEFTLDELRELTAFLKTDLGKKFMQKSPALSAKVIELAQRALQDHLSELTDALQKRAKELRKK